MTLPANALTTVESVNATLGYTTGDDAARDALIERYIALASDTIEQMCGRKFYRATDYAERVPAGQSIYIQIYDHYPLVSISSITYDDDTATTIDSSDYEISEADAGMIRNINGGWRNTQVYTFSGPTRYLATPEALRDWVPAYTVTYTGGYITPQQEDDGVGDRTLPFDLEQAAIDAAVSQYYQRTRDKGVSSVGMGRSSVSYGSANSTELLQSVISRYRVVTI